MVATALFDINADGLDRGFQATPSQVLTLRLRPPVDAAIATVLFQVWNAGAADPELGIAANPPRASSGAPTLTIVGATSGQAVSPTLVNGTVSITLPASAGHSWLVRCVVNGGWRALPGGGVVLDPTLIHERGIFIPTGFGLRKVVSTEVSQFAIEGWADAVNAMLALGGAPAETFLPSGLGAVSRQIGQFLDQGIHVFNFLSDAARADAIAGTLGFDHQAALQAAIDFTIYRNGWNLTAPGARLQLGGAVYRCDDQLHVGYGVDFRSVIVEGEGTRSGGNNGDRGSGTAIVFTHKDAPGICVQGGRNIVLRAFSIFGENYDHALAKMVSIDMSGLDETTWVGSGMSNERYRPYVGIAIDPRSGAQPGAPYKDAVIPAWLGVIAQYNKEASSNTLISDVDIRGFVGAIGQQCCDYDGNGDYTKLERVQLFYCAWGLSWGNSQSRVMGWKGCTFYGMHTGFHTGVHGRQQGKPSVTVSDTEFSGLVRIFDLATLDFGEGPSFTGCFGEGLYSFGRTQGARYAGGVSFQSCEFGFTLWESYGVPATVFDHGARSLVRFANTNFFNPIGKGAFHFHATGFDGNVEPARLFEFSGCSSLMRDSAAETDRWAKCAQSGTLGITIANGSTCLERFSFQSGDTYDLDTGDLIEPRFFGERNKGPRNRGLNVYSRYAKSLGEGNDPGVPVAWRNRGINANGGIVSQVGREVEFIFTGVDTTYLMVTGGDVGDVLICHRTKAVFWVKKRVGDHIFLRAQTGFDADGNLFSALVSDELFDTVNCRRYMPAAVLYGDITSGSPTITNVRDGSGSLFGAIGSHVTANDFLYVDEEVDQIISPYAASVLSFDNAAHTITMGDNFTVTRTRIRLGPFVRLPMPNAA